MGKGSDVVNQIITVKYSNIDCFSYYYAVMVNFFSCVKIDLMCTHIIDV